MASVVHIVANDGDVAQQTGPVKEHSESELGRDDFGPPCSAKNADYYN